jgi:membrane protein YdbS with pleckstrin-like domain
MTNFQTATEPDVDPSVQEWDVGSIQSRAERLYESGDLAASEVLFAKLQSIPDGAEEGLYGLGMVRMSRGDTIGAEKLFLQISAGHRKTASARYQLGAIAELDGRVDDACDLYQEALSADATLGAARAKLERYHPLRHGIGAGAAGAVNPRAESVGEQYGLYGLLLADGTPLSKRTLEIIDNLRMTVTPRFISHEGRVYALVGLTIALFLLLKTSAPDLSHWQDGTVRFDPAFVSQFNGLFALWTHLAEFLLAVLIGFQYLAVRCTSYRLNMGRLEIRSGVILRRMHNIELWRVEETDMRQGLLNRLTGDTQQHFIVLSPQHKHVTKVAGLVGIEHVDDFYFQLRNLIFLLRSNPAVKGIIY